MYKIMLREAPATRLDVARWHVLLNPDETDWSTEDITTLDEKLKEVLLNTPKNNIKVIEEVDWELLIKHPEPETPSDEPEKEPDEPEKEPDEGEKEPDEDEKPETPPEETGGEV